MFQRFSLAIIGLTAIAGCLWAQSFPRRAAIVGGGGPDRCTIEVVVDGSAEIEVRGDSAILRNLAGRPPEWRRFDCTAPMPLNPPGFRFSGVDGRGRQTLVRDPRGGGAAVIRIDDPDGGADKYKFDLFWGGAPERGRFEDRDRGRRDPEAFYREREGWFRGENWRERFFQRVKDDVEYVQSNTFPFGSDQYRLARTKQELDELQQQYASGRWDERELDDVVRALREVVRDNRMSPRDRDLLEDDLRRIEELRARRPAPGGRDLDAFYREREEFYRGPNWRGRLFYRVRQDVEHVQAVTFPIGGDQFRLARTIQELDELQNQWGSGRYDERQLEDVVRALQRVLEDNRLSPRDRNLLTDDLERMRGLRYRR